VAADLELWKKREEEKVKNPEKISIVDRGGNHRTVDLVEETKVPKWEYNH
jgi:hypothetical protein